MGVANFSTTDYLQGAFAYGSRPFLVHIKAYHATSAVGTFWATGETTAANHARGLVCSNAGSGVYQARERDTSNIFAQLTDGALAATWRNMSGVFIGDTHRELYLNALTLAETAGTRVLNAQTITRIGGWPDSTLMQSGWIMAELSIWDVTGFTSTDRQDLHDRLRTTNGSSEYPDARTVNEDAAEAWTGVLVRYWKFEDNTDLTDLVGGTETFTATGTVNTGTHPSMEAYTGGGGFSVAPIAAFYRMMQGNN